jgi:menaquinone-dependent protoporphyrinogen oxidase
MTGRILVAYATQFGSTAEIADAVAVGLRDSGAAVDVSRVQDIGGIEPYGAIVVGSAIHRGHVLPEAVEFVERHQAHLTRVAVALFCTHITNPPRSTLETYLDDLRRLTHPVSEAFFPGRFDRRGAALLIPKMLSWLVPPIDRRDWRTIRRWACDIAPLLTSVGECGDGVRVPD